MTRASGRRAGIVACHGAVPEPGPPAGRARWARPNAAGTVTPGHGPRPTGSHPRRALRCGVKPPARTRRDHDLEPIPSWTPRRGLGRHQPGRAGPAPGGGGAWPAPKRTPPPRAWCCRCQTCSVVAGSIAKCQVYTGTELPRSQAGGTSSAAPAGPAP